METFRPRKSPLSDRFLSPFSSLETLTTNSSATDNGGSSGGGWELDEGDVFWIGTEFSSPTTAFGVTSHSPSSLSPQGSFRRLVSEKSFGILAALPENEKKSGTVKNPPLLQRKSSISSSTSTSPSSSSSRMMMIPVIPKPRLSDYGGAFSMPGGGRLFQLSAPVNIPVVPRREQELERDDVNDDDDDEMLPPHEIVARASAKDTPMTTFSVLEGVGRTLKGRDLRRVRNAVWRQTEIADPRTEQMLRVKCLGCLKDARDLEASSSSSCLAKILMRNQAVPNGHVTGLRAPICSGNLPQVKPCPLRFLGSKKPPPKVLPNAYKKANHHLFILIPI